jgi:hypothetical protein
MRERFIIGSVENHWIVISGDGSRQAYDDHSQAIHMAVRAAETSGQNGHDAQVLSLDARHQTYPLWTYGHDAFTAFR